MANTIYPKYKDAAYGGGANTDLLTGVVKFILVDSADYTPSITHQFLSDVPVAARVGITTAITGKTLVNGLFSGVIPDLSAVTGDPSEILVVFIDTGVEGTSRLVAWFDTGVTGLPVTPNGGNILITENVSGIVQF